MNQTSPSPNVRRIGWVIDPDSVVDKNLMIRTFTGLKSFLDDEGCVVEPIQVMNRGLFATLKRKFARREASEAQSMSFIRRVLSSLKSSFEILPPRIFEGSSISDQTLSYYLSCYAQLSHTDLLLATEGTRKKILQPLRLSFLSVLGLQSRVPVMVIGPKNRFVRRTQSILFPVIDPDKSQGFEDIIELAKLSSAKITVLYRFLDESKGGYWIPMSGQFGSIPFFEPSTLQERNSKLKILSSWIKMGREKGVTVEIKLDKSSAGFATAVLKFQEKNEFDLIAVDPAYFESYYFEGAMMRIVKESPCPLWISHPVGQSACEALLKDIKERLAAAA